jgi:hypothetical protein
MLSFALIILRVMRLWLCSSGVWRRSLAQIGNRTR